MSLPRNLPIDFLRSFVTIADLNSFTKAGDLLGRTQSALSLQIKKLEELVGQPLFDRQGHKFTLTKQGVSLAAYARQMLKLNDQALYDLNPHRYEGHLRLGIPSEFAGSILSKTLGSFSRHYPGVTLEVHCDLSKNLRPKFHNDKYDVVFMLNEYTPVANEENKTYVLGQDQLVWVGTHSIKQLPSMQEIPLIVAEEGCIYRKYAIAWLEERNIPWRIVYNINEISGMLAALEEDIGVTVLAKSVVPENLSVISVADETVSIGDVYIEFAIHPNYTQPAAERLLYYLKQALV